VRLPAGGSVGLAWRMDTRHVAAAIDQALEGRRLLEHPFYQRWETGELRAGELARYAEQYRLVEQALPDVLGAIARALPAGPARDRVEATRTDELSRPAAHVELFESFASAVGAGCDVEALPATANLIALQREAAGRSPLEGLAGLATYEVQATAIAASKADGLRRHYGLDAAGTAFWDVHTELEADHADWSIEALGSLSGEDVDHLAEAARAGADAWWAFLDEREALAPALAG
jgi:pyrroloquinoline-quinone synthase